MFLGNKSFEEARDTGDSITIETPKFKEYIIGKPAQSNNTPNCLYAVQMECGKKMVDNSVIKTVLGLLDKEWRSYRERVKMAILWLASSFCYYDKVNVQDTKENFEALQKECDQSDLFKSLFPTLQASNSQAYLEGYSIDLTTGVLTVDTLMGINLLGGNWELPNLIEQRWIIPTTIPRSITFDFDDKGNNTVSIMVETYDTGTLMDFTKSAECDKPFIKIGKGQYVFNVNKSVRRGNDDSDDDPDWNPPNEDEEGEEGSHQKTFGDDTTFPYTLPETQEIPSNL